MNKNIIIIVGILIASIYCCTSTTSSNKSSSSIIAPQKEFVIPSQTPYVHSKSNIQEPTISNVEQNNFQEPKQQTSYPVCNQVHAGNSTTCIIEKAYCSYQPKIKGSPTFCNDGPYPKNIFTYLVWGNDLSNLSGHCIIVSGKVILYKGKPEIEAQSQSGFKGLCD
jgi:hypothetical protein